MKKFFVSIFAVFYLGLSCGFAFNIHFCMGKISSVDLFHSDKNTCRKCGMKNRKGCCDTKFTFVKISDSQQSSSATISIVSPLTAIVHYYTYSSLQPVAQPQHVLVSDTSPPPVSGAFLCILNSVFTI